MPRLITWFFAGCCLLVLIVVAALTVIVFLHIDREGFAWVEMDWDRSGHISLGEILDSIDYGRRQVTVGGKICVEIFALKDGRQIQMVCE